MTSDRRVLIALGSNLGDRDRELAAARAELERWGELLAQSEVLETAPWGLAREAYRNQVLDLRCGLLPWRLLRVCKDFELSRGRDPRAATNSARTIDLDLLLMDRVTMRSASCALPHPRLWRRRFLHEVLRTLPSVAHWEARLSAAGLWGGEGRTREA